MIVTLLTMEQYTETAKGIAILKQAHENKAMHLTQRLLPTNPDDPNVYSVMLLDWSNAMMVKCILTGPEVTNFAEALTTLSKLGVLDAFSTQGATVQ